MTFVLGKTNPKVLYFNGTHGLESETTAAILSHLSYPGASGFFYQYYSFPHNLSLQMPLICCSVTFLISSNSKRKKNLIGLTSLHQSGGASHQMLARLWVC